MSTTTPQEVIVGTRVDLEADLTDFAGVLTDATVVHWVLRAPDGSTQDLSDDVEHDGLGKYHVSPVADAPGEWYWRLVTEGLVTAAEGSFTAVSVFDAIDDPNTPTDLRVLVPRVRRYCEGPYGPPKGKPALSENQVYAMAADACAEIILYTGNLLGHKLIVTARDQRAGFPVGWATEAVLDEWETALIATQAALNYWFFVFRDMRTSQTVMNEGTSVEWTVSVNIIRDYIKSLQDARDKAIAGLRLHHPVIDRFVSNIRVRDQATVTMLEWWDHNSRGALAGGMPGGQEAAVIPWTPGWTGTGFTLGVGA